MVARRADAWNFRIAGFTYRQIADKIGCSTSTAHDLVKHELFDTTDVMRDQVREGRQIELARVEKMINRCWLSAFPAEPNAKPDYDAIRTILRCSERKAKLLGLEAPQKHQVDMNHLNSQVALVVEMIARVIPDESVPQVYAAVEEAMGTIEKRERAMTVEEVA